MWFSMRACLPILRLPLNLWHRKEFESGLRSWFQVLVGLARKTRQILTVNFIFCLEKCDFLQMILNIGKLYTIEKYFSSRVWIRDHYLKIRLHLAQIHLKSFCFYTKKSANNLGIFRWKQKVLFWSGSYVEHNASQIHHRKQLEKVVSP